MYIYIYIYIPKYIHIYIYTLTRGTTVHNTVVWGSPALGKSVLKLYFCCGAKVQFELKLNTNCTFAGVQKYSLS